MQTETLEAFVTKKQHYIATLVMKHDALSSILDEEYKYPFKNLDMINYLKSEKLRLKDLIEKLKSA